MKKASYSGIAGPDKLITRFPKRDMFMSTWLQLQATVYDLVQSFCEGRGSRNKYYVSSIVNRLTI
jgi:hypothetical protein